MNNTDTKEIVSLLEDFIIKKSTYWSIESKIDNMLPSGTDSTYQEFANLKEQTRQLEDEMESLIGKAVKISDEKSLNVNKLLSFMQYMNQDESEELLNVKIQDLNDFLEANTFSEKLQVFYPNGLPNSFLQSDTQVLYCNGN